MNVTMSGDLLEVLKARIEAIRSFPDEVLGICEEAAAELRETDSYQDRTGDLRASTRAIPAIGGNASAVALEMGEPYASFVKRRGFSNWDEVSERTRVRVQRAAKDALGAE